MTAGATEAIAASLLALCETGDEVIALEPYYDSYAACIAMAGAIRRPITLRPPAFTPDLDALRRRHQPPHPADPAEHAPQPDGHGARRGQLAEIARLAVEHDLLVVTDEVYEHLTFGVAHVPIAGFPGMRERTVTIGSGGKTFSVTGWKVGWVTAPAALVTAVRTAKQFLTYVSSGPFQPAIAAGLALPDAYFHGLADDHRAKRDRLVAGLEEAGLDVFVPDGTYFVTTDITPLGADAAGGDGLAFCRSLPERCGVVAVPCSVFYDDQAAGRSLVRFAFCKRDDVIDEAVARLKGLRR